MEDISAEELEERVALLKKFRSLLQQQRDRFREYLAVLEKQESSIEAENTEALAAHTELGQQVVSSIRSLQKVIVPMSALYNSHNLSQGEKSITELQDDLSDLQSKVLAQNEKNRKLLRTHMSQLRTKIDAFRNPYRHTRSVYAEKNTTGSVVAVEA